MQRSCAAIGMIALALPSMAQIPDIWPIGAAQAAALLVGSNVQISNVSYTGDFWQMARFTDGSSKIGFPEGIALTTGRATYAGYDMLGGYPMSTGNGDWGGARPVEAPIDVEPDLNSMNGAGSVKSAAVFEFDIITTGTELSMEFVFASEEYPEYVCSNFNDVFGIFLSGPGISGPYQNNAVNIASVPGTTVPIAINTVNNGDPGVQGNGPQVCAAQDPNWTQNSVYYVDNLFSNPDFEQITEANAFWVYDGHTVVLTVQYAVQCNTTYHLKYAICNTGDYGRDSGMFIKAGSISSPYPAPGPLSIAPSPVCAGEEVTLTVQGDPSWNYTWSTGQSGVGLQTVTTTASLGQNSYSVTAEYLPGCSLATASPAAMLTVHDPQNSPPQCLGVNGTGVYNTTIQVGEQTCFTIPTSDAANELVQITPSGGTATGSFQSNGASHATGTFCWTPGITDVGFHTLDVLLSDNNTCGELTSGCTITIKVVCDFCPVRVYYERRNPDMYPLPALTVAGESITAGYSVDPAQQDGYVVTGDDPVEFRAPYIDLQPGFIAGPGFLAVVDPNTCLEDCDVCCDGWGGFTVDTHGEGTHNVLSNVFTPNGDGVNDRWEVLDIDHPYCAYGAMAYRLDFFSQWGHVYHHEEPWTMGCCPFQSWAPSNPVVSSISWDGRANRGAWFCNGCYVSNSVYYYVLTLYGCNGEVTYTGYVNTFGSPAGMVTEPTPPLQDALGTLVADSLVASLPDEFLSGPLMAGVEASAQQPALHLRPNPATDQVWLEYAPGLAQVWLLDATGRRVLELAPQGAPTTILQVEGLAPASYFLVAVDIEGMVHNRKLIKQ